MEWKRHDRGVLRDALEAVEWCGEAETSKVYIRIRRRGRGLLVNRKRRGQNTTKRMPRFYASSPASSEFAAAATAARRRDAEERRSMAGAARGGAAAAAATVAAAGAMDGEGEGKAESGGVAIANAMSAFTGAALPLAPPELLFVAFSRAAAAAAKSDVCDTACDGPVPVGDPPPKLIPIKSVVFRRLMAPAVDASETANESVPPWAEAGCSDELAGRSGGGTAAAGAAALPAASPLRAAASVGSISISAAPLREAVREAVRE